jgi:hypothetical protein
VTLSVNGALTDRIALALLEHGPTSCEQLARIVEARTSDVRRALRDDPRFEHVGAGRGSRWRLALEPSEAVWDGLGRILSEGSRSTDGSAVEARLGELERRLDALERRLPNLEPAP